MPGGAGTGEQSMVCQGPPPSSVREQQELGCSTESSKGEGKCDTSTHTRETTHSLHTQDTGNRFPRQPRTRKDEQRPGTPARRQVHSGCRARAKLAATWI